jgi:ABC-type dipeptide/oligopeptide/nickel transport system permease component
MRITLIFIFTCFFFINSIAQSKTIAEVKNKPTNQTNSTIQSETQLEDLKHRFLVKYSNLLASNLWTLTHTYKSKQEVDNVLDYLQNFFTALEKND